MWTTICEIASFIARSKPYKGKQLIMALYRGMLPKQRVSRLLISSVRLSTVSHTSTTNNLNPSFEISKLTIKCGTPKLEPWKFRDHEAVSHWMSEGIARPEKTLHPRIQEFKDIIETDSELFQLFTQMFEEVPERHSSSEAQNHQIIKNYETMLKLLNNILTEAPKYNKTIFIGVPITAIFDWSMGTTSGMAVFRNEKVNQQLKKILNAWGVYLSSPMSRTVLSTDEHTGWLGKQARIDMLGDDTIPMESVFKCNPALPYFGFRSWDDFFTREFVDGVRPIASPGDDSVIVNACESAPYCLARNVQRTAKFWLKGQPYSLLHMLNNDPLVDQFVGGTVYQAFLSPTAYHRWHAPVSGTIVKAYVVDGTYYSETPHAENDGVDFSQGYLTEVATRGMVFIQADNPDIGLMCFMAVGMSEVSTIDITAKIGQHVTKGDQLGMFHFGGSTHCLLFGPQVNLQFEPDVKTYDNKTEIPVLNVFSKIATVGPRKK